MAATKAEKFKILKDLVVFCPGCKQRMRPLDDRGTMMTCPDMHGSMTLIGDQPGSRQAKAVFELYEE